MLAFRATTAAFYPATTSHISRQNLKFHIYPYRTFKEGSPFASHLSSQVGAAPGTPGRFSWEPGPLRLKEMQMGTRFSGGMLLPEPRMPDLPGFLIGCPRPSSPLWPWRRRLKKATWLQPVKVSLDPVGCSCSHAQ